MKPSTPKPAHSLRIWIPLVFAVFVVLGSIGLLVVFEHRQQSEERKAFEELARVNAAFMERTRLPRTEQMADRLSEVIGADVFFRESSSGRVLGPDSVELPDSVLSVQKDGKVSRLPSNQLVVVIQDELGVETIFLRDPQFRGLTKLGSDAWLSVGLFWLLSLALGLALSRWVSAPLQSLVSALPKVGTSEALPSLPTKRRDEIGSLARVLEATHQSLGEERDLRRRAERLALLGRMATGIAHEIRNPAAAIRLHAELLDAADAESLAKSRGLIIDEAKRLENLVSQWMHYSRPEPPSTSDVDVSSMLQDVISVMEPQARHMNVTIEMTRPETDELIVRADQQRLHQVFTNLVLNGIQAMPKGGRLAVEILQIADRVEVTVSDQGAGFSDEALERAGEAFYSEREGGLGLGLAVAVEICRAHGGSLHLSNLDPNGACIRVVLHQVPPNDGGAQ